MERAGKSRIKVSEEEVLSRLASLFDEQALEQLARQSRFIERSSSRLSGWMFLQLHLLMESSGQEFSLSQMCEELFERHGVVMSKQSLDERFNTFAVSFLRQCFNTVFEQVLGYQPVTRIHPVFERVLLTDATSFQLPAHLAAFYQGNGGGNGPAGIKIHQQYELLSGTVRQLEVRDGKESDVNLLQDFDYSQVERELHLLDLGYFKIKHLQALDEAGGYFISRYKTGVTLYSQQGEVYQPINWVELLDKVAHNIALPELYLGSGPEKLPVRVIIEKVPAPVAAKRRLKQKRKIANVSKKARYRYGTSALKELLMDYNIFITNTTHEQLTDEQVQLYYRLRWQIELLFKIWKSVLELDKIGKMSIFRFECYLYSRLLVLLLSTQVANMLRSVADVDFELSEWKAMRYLKKE
jgi:IS4 transposase